MPNSIIKKIATEITGTGIESGFAALASAAGFPAIALPLAKGLILGLIENCYNDCAQRTISRRESKKLNQVYEVAIQTFRELAEADGVVAWEIEGDPSYLNYAYEVAEHVTLEAMRQAELNKVNILGRFYGKTMYEGRTDWNDLHQITSMTGELSFRQLVLIRLISEGFYGINNECFISNPHACVEIKQLLQFGIWKLSGMPFSENNSAPLQIRNLCPTSFARMISDSLMLSSISENDLQRVVDSLGITPDGVVEEMLEGSITHEEMDRICK